METKKLTCCDLMVGDWVKYKDRTVVQIARVGDVSPMDAPIYCHTQMEGYFPCQLDDISPIPLTAEILEKNGFKYNDIPIVLGWEQYGLTLYRGGDGFLINCGQNVALIINYVHELQHALRLCGEDKEIVL